EIVDDGTTIEFGAEPGVRSLVFSGDGKLLAGLIEGRITTWDPWTGAQVQPPFGVGAVENLALSPDGKRAATTYRDGRIKLWDVATGQEVLTLKTVPTPRLGGPQLVFSPDGEKLAVSAPGRIEIFSATAPKMFPGE